METATKTLTRAGIPDKINPYKPISDARQEKKDAQAKQTQSIGEQKQKEGLRLAEGVDELARRKLRGKTGGARSLLSAGNPSGGLLASRSATKSLVPK